MKRLKAVVEGAAHLDPELRSVAVQAIGLAGALAVACGRPDLEEDCGQVALAAVVAQWGTYDREKGTFGGYAYWAYRGAVLRCLRNERRRRSREVSYDEPAPTGIAAIAAGYMGIIAGSMVDHALTDPVDPFADPEFIRLLRAFMEQLDERDAPIFEMCFLEGCSSTEIAAALNIPDRTVRWRVGEIEKALEELRDPPVGRPSPKAKPKRKLRAV